MMFDDRTHSRPLQPLQEHANDGVKVGMSSWKYPGRCGQVYDAARYNSRGKFSEGKFERECLSEYADIFPTVCVDAGYCEFTSPQHVASLCQQVPQSFRLGFKVRYDHAESLVLGRDVELLRFWLAGEGF